MTSAFVLLVLGFGVLVTRAQVNVERERQAELIRQALLTATSQPDLEAPPGGPAQEAGA